MAMDDMKRTKAEQQAYADLLTCLAAQERWMRAWFAAGGKLPTFGAARTNAPEVELELDLDADVVKWFKALGPIHLARMNAVLRVYAREAWRESAG
jgi:uncharacterized protein (DUF4415 family)